MDDNGRLADQLREYFARTRRGLVAVYLFGSRARGTARESSDIDLGLLFLEPPEPSIGGPAARVEDDLEHLTGRPVQAVVLNCAPPDLIHRVLRDGVLLHETDPSRRVSFEVEARREYLDLVPVLRAYRRAPAS